MTCFIRGQSLSNFDRRSFFFVCSSRVFNMPLMLDQCTLGFCVLSSVDSLCISMISSFKTHSLGLPGFLFWFIELKLSDLRFKDVHAIVVCRVFRVLTCALSSLATVSSLLEFKCLLIIHSKTSFLTRNKKAD